MDLGLKIPPHRWWRRRHYLPHKYPQLLLHPVRLLFCVRVRGRRGGRTWMGDWLIGWADKGCVWLDEGSGCGSHPHRLSKPAVNSPDFCPIISSERAIPAFQKQYVNNLQIQGRRNRKRRLLTEKGMGTGYWTAVKTWGCFSMTLQGRVTLTRWTPRLGIISSSHRSLMRG